MDVILFLLLKVPSQYFKCHSMLSSLSPQHVIWVKVGLNDHQSSLTRGSENISKGNVSPYSESERRQKQKESFQGIMRSLYVCGGGRWEQYCRLSCLFLSPTVCFNICWSCYILLTSWLSRTFRKKNSSAQECTVPQAFKGEPVYNLRHSSQLSQERPSTDITQYKQHKNRI